MTAKHAPGPWSIGELITGNDLPDHSRDIFSEIKDAEGGTVALVDATPVDDERLPMNSALIAAAPALLEALKGVLRALAKCPCSVGGRAAVLPYDDPSLAEARAAIALAEKGGE